MDEERITPTITPEGIAGVWLSTHMPEADRNIQISLGKVIKVMIAEGVHKGLQNALVILKNSPTPSAAADAIEFNALEMKHISDEFKLERMTQMASKQL